MAFTGGIPIPYFSDTGRDSPAYYIFASGFTVASIFLVATGYLNMQWVIYYITPFPI
jgi:hypothetical protein